MRNGVVHVIGHLNNRQDPIKLGQVSEQDPVVSFLKVAQNIDIDDRGVATTRDGQEERYLGSISSLFVHPNDDKVAYFLEQDITTGIVDIILNGGFDDDSVWNTQGVWDISGGKATKLGAGALIQDISLSAGSHYRVSFTVLDYVGSDFAELTLYSSAGSTASDWLYGNGTLTQVLTPSNDITAVWLQGLGVWQGAFDNVSIVEVDAEGTPIETIIGTEPVLKQLNTDFTATEIATLNSDNNISYAVINGLVFLSNGVDIGYIENGAFVPFSQTLLRDELPMPAGEYVAYSDNEGVLLVASGNTVYRSKPWNPQVRDARHSEFPMNGKVRMLATVEDGWFVGTEKNVSFAQMDNADGYTFRHVTDSVPPDGAFFKEFHFDEDKGTASQMRVIWASPDGFIEGTSGGGYENHSYPNVSLPEGNKGKVFNRNVNGTNQYLAVIFNPEDDNNYVAPTLLKNRITP